MERYIFNDAWYGFVRQNERVVKPSCHAVIFALYEIYCRSDFKDEFEVPSSLIMSFSGVKNYATLNSLLRQLESDGFIKTVTKSVNRYMPRVITFKGCKQFSK